MKKQQILMRIVVKTICHHGVESTTIWVLFQVKSVVHVEEEVVKIILEEKFVKGSSIHERIACLNELIQLAYTF